MNKRWVEGVVTSVLSNRVFITFKEGSTICPKQSLSLGDVVDICVVPTRGEDCFDVVEMGNTVRRRDDLTVEPFETTKCSVYCTAEVIDRNRGCFLLDTPIIGLAIFPLKDAPREMEVGDMWRVKMLRRKEKKGAVSFWWAIGVNGDHPRVATGLSRRKEREDMERKEREEREMDEREMGDHANTSGYSSFESFPSTPNTSQESEWTTVIITGSDSTMYYGSCTQADVIRIPMKKFNLYNKNLSIGAFYRVKITKARDGAMKANDIDLNAIYPRNIEVDATKNPLQLWCYSQIVDSLPSAFVVRNELIGDAILPFNTAAKEMRVGDKLETLYRRVRTGGTWMNWVVIEAAFDRSKNDCGDKSDNEIEVVEKLRENKATGEERATKDRRILDIMRHLMSFAIVGRTFTKEDSKALETIDRILKKDEKCAL